MTTEKSNALTIITTALSLPGVKVNREAFLLETLKVSAEDRELLLEKGPIKSGLFTQEKVKEIAKSICSQKTLKTTSASFLAGLPGGVAMAATIPADTAQFFGFTLRLAQEVAYLYGVEDLWDGDELLEEKVQGELMLYLATMFGVAGASSALRIISARVAANIGKNIAKTALTKTIWYPIVKSVGKYLGIKITKDTVARGAAKVIPILGGITSGALTYFTMKKMTERLIKALDKGVVYTEREKQTDIDILREEMPEVYDAIYEEIK
ncbi:hypothetical protein ACLSZP_06525 [Avibacterium avium]|uniref:hypothetical protein n=1 Tax=Avibacterium avium TaxID=751 RepID=UPI003BF84C6C